MNLSTHLDNKISLKSSIVHLILCSVLLISSLTSMAQEKEEDDFEFEISVDVKIETVPDEIAGDYKLYARLNKELGFVFDEKYEFVEVYHTNTGRAGILSKKQWLTSFKNGQSPDQKVFILSPVYEKIEYAKKLGLIANLGKDGGIQVYNRKLKRIIKDQFEEASFSKIRDQAVNVVSVTKNGQSAVYNFSGKQIIPFRHKSIEFEGNYFLAIDDGSKTLYDLTGEQLFPTFSDDEMETHIHDNDIMLVLHKNKAQQPRAIYINLNQLDTIRTGTGGGRFSGSYAPVSLKRSTGIIDETGAFVMAPVLRLYSIDFLHANTYAFIKKGNPAHVKSGGNQNNEFNYALFDLTLKENHEIPPTSYPEGLIDIDLVDYLFIYGPLRMKVKARVDGKEVASYALMTRTGEFLATKTRLLSISKYNSDGLAIAENAPDTLSKRPYFSLIDTKGEAITMEPYEAIEFYKKHIIVKKDGLYGSIYPNGRTELEFINGTLRVIKSKINNL